MIALYFLAGSVLSLIGGAAPGASNLAVIKKTSDHNLQAGLRIAYGAGLGEAILAFFALSYSLCLLDFFEMNIWIKITVGLAFVLVGLFFMLNLKLLRKKDQTQTAKDNTMTNGLLLGGFLAFANPPVLLYWILVISVVQSNWLPLNTMISGASIALFLIGVLLGKVLVLYLYAIFGNKMAKKSKNTKLDAFIGTTLLLLGTFQIIRLLF